MWKLLEMWYSYSSPSPLTGLSVMHLAIVGNIPIMEVAELVLPHLPALLICQQLSRETRHPTSLLKWLAVQGGREAEAGLVLQFAQKLPTSVTCDGPACYVKSAELTRMVLGGDNRPPWHLWCCTLYLYPQGYDYEASMSNSYLQIFEGLEDDNKFVFCFFRK